MSNRTHAPIAFAAVLLALLAGTAWGLDPQIPAGDPGGVKEEDRFGVWGPPALDDGRRPLPPPRNTMGKIEIKGVIRDDSGEPLRASITSDENPPRFVAVYSDRNDGAFSMWLDPGIYAIKVSINGYRVERSSLMIGGEQALDLSFSLRPLTLAGAT